jgi:hypothetical protein
LGTIGVLVVDFQLKIIRLKLPFRHVAEAFKPVLRSLHRTIGTSRTVNLYRTLRTFEPVSIGAEKIFEKSHSIACHRNCSYQF